VIPVISYRDHPHLYELNTWSWLTELAHRAGKKILLGDVCEREWDRLRAQGFDFVWLMGIWERSPEARRIGQITPDLQREYDSALPNWRPEHVVGSPYAIHSYQPDPQLATWEDVDLTRERLRERGMGLILDFVPNHTAVDHVWVTDRPELYVNIDAKPDGAGGAAFFPIQNEQQQGPCIAHGKDPYFPAWSDTAQLDHFNPATRSALLEQLQLIAMHCDGVRCDMAMLVLNGVFEQTWAGFLQHRRPQTEFWSDAIAAIPDLVWIAEVYWDRERDLQEIGFSFTYDKLLYDKLREGRAQEVRRGLAAAAAYQKKLVRFLENHDEPRSASAFGVDHFPAAGVLSGTLPGMRLYHQGQFEGKRVRLPVQLCRARVEDPDPYFIRFYDNLLRWTNEEVFHTGVWTLLPVDAAGDSSNEDILAYQWRSLNDWKLLVVNLSPSGSRGLVRLIEGPSDAIEKESSLLLLDLLTERNYRHSGAQALRDGLYIELGPFDAHFFSASHE